MGAPGWEDAREMPSPGRKALLELGLRFAKNLLLGTSLVAQW